MKQNEKLINKIIDNHAVEWNKQKYSLTLDGAKQAMRDYLTEIQSKEKFEYQSIKKPLALTESEFLKQEASYGWVHYFIDDERFFYFRRQL